MIKTVTTLKSYGVILICFCAVLLETLFLSFGLDLGKLDVSNFDATQLAFYDAQMTVCKMMNIITTGILGLFSFVLLFFSIERYIDENKANMGVLKALGYGNNRIAIGFIKFFIPVFIGCLAGYLAALSFKNVFYKTMNEDNFLPDVVFQFRISILLIDTLVPSLLVIIFSYIVARLKLNKSPLDMINEKEKTSKRKRLTKQRDNFLHELRNTALKNHIILIIFVGFAVLCFSATLQMSFSLLKQANTSYIFFWMCFLIGLLLGVTILFLAFKFVFKGNKKYMAMLKAYGYNDKECYYAMYGGYHIVSIISFIIGTIYCGVLMSIMFSVFTEAYGIEYKFDYLGLVYTFLIFAFFYVICNIMYFKKISKLELDNLNADLG